ncbi:hypothetical protein ABK040_007810 [Willaertia magna]
MTKHQCKVAVPLSKDEYWKIIFTDEYDQYIAPLLNFKRIEIDTSTSQTGDIVKRIVRVFPNYEVPSAILWYLGQNEFHYIDNQEKDLAKEEIRTNTLPPVYADYVQIATRQYLEAIDESSCYHILDIDITCSAWGIGSIVESAVITGLDEGYKLLPNAVNAWKSRNEKKETSDVAITEEAPTTL